MKSERTLSRVRPTDAKKYFLRRFYISVLMIIVALSLGQCMTARDTPMIDPDPFGDRAFASVYSQLRHPRPAFTIYQTEFSKLASEPPTDRLINQRLNGN